MESAMKKLGGGEFQNFCSGERKMFNEFDFANGGVPGPSTYLKTASSTTVLNSLILPGDSDCAPRLIDESTTLHAR